MRVLLLPLAALALAACQPASPPAGSEPAAVATPGPLPEPPDATPIDASYACEGNRVDLINDRATARIAMNDGRVVSLGGMRGSTPETWRDVGLGFTIDNRQDPAVVELAQDNGPVLRCELLPAASPTTPGEDAATPAGSSEAESLSDIDSDSPWADSEPAAAGRHPDAAYLREDHEG